MKKIISFCLWGTNPKYTIGAIKNAELAPKIYPGWICRYYIGRSTPQEIINVLLSKPHVEVVLMDEEGSWNSMFWRFYPISDDDTEIMLSRDCDSRISIREKLCVDEFIKSDKLFHSMIDHPWHGGIMGGMWGVKNGILKEMKYLIDVYAKSNEWNTDQNFLNHVISPMVSDVTMLHDSINLNNFLSERVNKEFVGDVFDENDNRHHDYYRYIV